jgi:hypothetical protein
LAQISGFNGFEIGFGEKGSKLENAMTAPTTDLDNLVLNALLALAEPTGEAAHADTTSRERFFELMVLILGNLYTKTPISSPLFDRATLTRVTAGMDDGDAGRFTTRTEDWLRLEGLLRQQDGAKAYYITRPTLAVLSTLTYAGTLGEVMDKVLRRYQEAMPSENLRRTTRLLGSYYLTRVARS